MTFPENFIFPGFPDPVGTLSYSEWEMTRLDGWLHSELFAF